MFVKVGKDDKPALTYKKAYISAIRQSAFLTNKQTCVPGVRFIAMT